MKQRTAIAGAAALLLLALLAACGGTEAPDAEEATADSVQAASSAQAPDSAAAQAADSVEVDIEDLKYTKLPDDTRVLTGELHNVSPRPFSRAQIQVSLFDAENRRVGTTSIDVQDIGAGQSKPFRQVLDVEAEVQSARVRDVLVFRGEGG